ncbi:MAG: hypothetical protein HYU66_16650 [Armatimonadetes bacterium]|nr:hypothetical protein [Armatimonadota bacterium]
MKLRMRTIGALALAVLAVTTIAVAQGPGGGGGGGRRGGMRNMRMGTIEKVTPTELTIRTFGGRPGGGGGNRQRQGGAPQGQSLAIDLSDQTSYFDLVDGEQADLAAGKAVAVSGDGDENQIKARALAVYREVKDDADRGKATLPLRLVSMRLRFEGREPGQFQPGQAPPPLAIGVIQSMTPFVVKAYNQDGTTRNVTIDLGDAKIHKISDIANDKLKVGNFAAVQLVPPPQGQPAQNDQPKPKAAAVLQQPPIQRPAGGGGN